MPVSGAPRLASEPEQSLGIGGKGGEIAALCRHFAHAPLDAVGIELNPGFILIVVGTVIVARILFFFGDLIQLVVRFEWRS